MINKTGSVSAFTDTGLPIPGRGGAGGGMCAGRRGEGREAQSQGAEVRKDEALCLPDPASPPSQAPGRIHFLAPCSAVGSRGQLSPEESGNRRRTAWPVETSPLSVPRPPEPYSKDSRCFPERPEGNILILWPQFSVSASQCGCHGSIRTALGDMSLPGHGCVPIKLYLQTQIIVCQALS